MKKKTHKHPPIPVGMSMAEIVIVLCVLSVLAAITTLTFSRVVARSQLQNAADRFISDLSLVRDQAYQDNTSYTFEINPDLRRYQAPGVPDLNQQQDIFVNLAAPPYQVGAMVLSLDNGEDITFDKKGKPSSVGEISLRRGSDEIVIGIDKVGNIGQPILKK